MNAVAVRDRGYNLMITALLLLGGFGHGAVGFSENDAPDKIDDFVLLVIGLLAVLFYRFAGQRFARTRIPLILVFVALAAQILGVALERDDREALGDNFGGMLFYVPLAVFAAWQYFRPLPVESPVIVPDDSLECASS